MIFLATAATYIIPAGEFTRYEDPVSGETLVQAGSYVSTGTNPANPLHMPMLMYDGILDAADVIAFLLIIGGSFELVNASGAILALCRTVGRKLRGKEIFVVPIFLALFAVFGTTMGMSNEVAIFVPIGITMALTLGLDKVTGMAMVVVGAVSGFTAGLMNPFTVGVAQDIAGVPLFSGMGLRAVLLIAMLVIDTFYTTRTTSSVGLGVPLFKMEAEMTGGSFTIQSQLGVGTNLTAVFKPSSVDMIPLGDINGTVQLLISCNPQLDFIFHRVLLTDRGERREFALKTEELRQVLGEDVPLDTPDVVLWIKEYLAEQTAELTQGALPET